MNNFEKAFLRRVDSKYPGNKFTLGIENGKTVVYRNGHAINIPPNFPNYDKIQQFLVELTKDRPTLVVNKFAFAPIEKFLNTLP